ncbi:hypothetical protein ACH4UR_25430 [Streptomyces lydicus]|uniref:hypothetical protein n=1 Tax=Streptomyces lydicus TaxID=47763 RepID=UPI00379FBFA1
MRTNGWWLPTPDDGSGFLTDAEVRAHLHKAVAQWDVRHRFVPAEPGRDLGSELPGRLVLGLPTVRATAQYVLDHQGTGGLMPMRELVARHDEDRAYDIPAVLTPTDLTDVLNAITTEQTRVLVTYDKAAGRLYARYERAIDGGKDTGLSSSVTCLHVFVLAASPAEV